MFGVILSTFLVFLLITSAHFLHRGVGDMRDALRQTGMFLLNRVTGRFGWIYSKITMETAQRLGFNTEVFGLLCLQSAVSCILAPL